MIAIKILYYQQYACILITKVKPIAVKYCYTRYCHENIIPYYKQQYALYILITKVKPIAVKYSIALYTLVYPWVYKLEYTQEKVFSANAQVYIRLINGLFSYFRLLKARRLSEIQGEMRR